MGDWAIARPDLGSMIPSMSAEAVPVIKYPEHEHEPQALGAMAETPSLIVRCKADQYFIPVAG